MSNSYKPGGGNKLQPYIPAGNGDRSGEYTNKPANQTSATQKRGVLNCRIRNVRFGYNFCHSSLVRKVTHFYISDQGVSISKTGTPNSVTKRIVNQFVVEERFYNSKGEAYLDIDYTCHGNPKRHPYVPHIHRWHKNEAGILERGDWEVFQ